MGLSSAVAHILHTLGILQRIPGDRLTETLEEARETSGQLLGR